MIKICVPLSLALCLTAGIASGAEPAEPAPAAEVNVLLEGVQNVLAGVDSYAPVETAPSAQVPLALDVKQCVELALRQNPQALMAEEDVNAKQELVGQAKSQRLPQVKAETGYAYTPNLDQQIGGGLAQILLNVQDFAPDKGIFSSRVSFEQVLYAGGQIQAAIRASNYLAKSEAWKRQAKLDQVEFETRQAFYDCLLAQALVQVAQDSVTTFERHLADARKMLDVGLVSGFEVLRAETELGARQTDVESARTAAEIAILNLRRILGVPQEQPIDLTGDMAWDPLDVALEALLTEARGKRAELHALDDGVSAAEQQVAMKRGQFKPKAAAGAQWQTADGGGQLLPDGWKFTVGAQWDLYAGGKRKHEVREAEAQLRSLQHQMTDVERLVDLDVRQAYLRAQEAIAKIRKEKGTVELGKEGLRLAQLRFQEGAGTQAETLDAELASTQARTTLAKALRDYAVALAALDKAVGRSCVPRETE
jgi:outer membrane protein TolC